MHRKSEAVERFESTLRREYVEEAKKAFEAALKAEEVGDRVSLIVRLNLACMYEDLAKKIS